MACPKELVLTILNYEVKGSFKNNCLIKDVANTYVHIYIGHNI
jgi:hypothetical protein